MKLGDLVSYEWGYSNAKIRITGILLALKPFGITNQHEFPRSARVQFSFELLEPDGKRNWYDVWMGESGPKVISSC